MSKQFWELDIKTNNYNKPDYHDDCTITIVALGNQREWTSNKNQTFVFQKISVLGANNTTIENGIELMYNKGEIPVTPDKLNTPLNCRIKVANDNSQYGLNGRKYIVAIGEKKQSSGSNSSYKSGSGGSGNYKASTPDEIQGKCETLFIEATLASGKYSPEQLFADRLQLAAIEQLAKWCQRSR